MPRLLLINPRFKPTFWSLGWFHEKILRRQRYPVAPLGLASIAALTPSGWDIAVADENVEEIDWNDPADIVGVAGMSSQYERQRQILQRFREMGKYVVAGGNHASLLPEHYEDIADTVIAGEAEYIWPRFCRDYVEGTPERLYRETGEVDLADSPTPRFDLLKLDRYGAAAVQFSRGCPFRCEFCDIIVIFGRKPRTKTNEQIGAELDALRAQGVRNIFFVDDNFIGHKPKARSLLRFLVEYQRRHGYRFFLGTEVSINLAEDDELLQLFRDAHFGWLFTGIESPSDASLKETLKFQNTRLDLLESVRRIHAKGISVQSGFIVGFDADDETIFDRQFRFIQDAGIYLPMVGLLVAIPRTPLWGRLEAAGRLRLPAESSAGDALAEMVATNTGPWSNIQPLQMDYRRLVEGYAALMRRLFEERAIFERLRNHMRSLHRPLGKIFIYPRREPFLVPRFILHGIILGGPRRVYYLLRSMLLTRGRPSRFGALIDFWAYSIALKAFANETLLPEHVAASLAADEASLGGRDGGDGGDGAGGGGAEAPAEPHHVAPPLT